MAHLAHLSARMPARIVHQHVSWATPVQWPTMSMWSQLTLHLQGRALLVSALATPDDLITRVCFHVSAITLVRPLVCCS